MTEIPRVIGSLESSAAAAARALEAQIAHVDAAWRDAARQEFEQRHLAAIRSDARHLQAELDGLLRTSSAITKQLKTRP